MQYLQCYAAAAWLFGRNPMQILRSKDHCVPASPDHFLQHISSP
jgi:hypothetical protein